MSKFKSARGAFLISLLVLVLFSIAIPMISQIRNSVFDTEIWIIGVINSVCMIMSLSTLMNLIETKIQNTEPNR